MKLSFSLPSKSSSKPNPIKPSPNFNDDKDSKSNGVVDSREYVTEFDGSKTLTTDTDKKPKNVSIAPIQNEWRPHKKMKNLELPIAHPDHDDSSAGLQFELESAASAAPDTVDSKISYGLNLRQKIEGSDKIENSTSNGGEERKYVAVEDVLLQKLKEDLKRLPEDRGMEEFEDMPVEGFGAALLAGYGWKEGMGIGKNAKEDVKIVEYTKKAGKHGIGFTAVDVPAKLNTELNSKRVEEERVKDAQRVSEGDRNRNRDKDIDRGRDSGLSGKEVRIVGGRNAGLKGKIIEKLDHDKFVLKLSRSEQSVKVSANDIAELGSKEEERYLKKLKELKIQEEVGRKESKRTREEGRRESRDSQKENQRNMKQASWLTSHIRVRIISKDLKGGRLHLKKGEVVDVVGPKMCDISMDESRELVQGVSQDLLETALPRRGGPVLVLSGKHKGVYGNLVERDLDREIGVVRDADTHSLLNVQFEQIAEYIGDPSLLGY
uniref:protein MOS2 n=1 Tax=Ziziphus jujuba TaxID=326968 RepID=A0A6P4A1U1_ZIZJJ